MSHEDIVIQSVLVARNHIEEMLEVGAEFMVNTSPITTTERDVIALKVVEHFLLTNGHDLLAVLSNLDDLIIWTPFLVVSKSALYSPLMSTNGDGDWHIGPGEFVDLLASFGVEASLIDAHHRAAEAFWWTEYVAKVVTGTVTQFQMDMELGLIEEEE